MNQVLEYAGNAKMVQVYQRETNALLSPVMPGTGFGQRDEEALVRELRRRVGPRMTIHIRLVDQFTLSPIGKLRAVISEVARDGDAPP